jgi:hypothetical protein
MAAARNFKWTGWHDPVSVGAGNLTTVNGTSIEPVITENGVSTVQTENGLRYVALRPPLILLLMLPSTLSSPDDGYSIVGIG